TIDQLSTMFPNATAATLNSYLPEYNQRLWADGIDTPRRMAFFFSNVNDESAGMTKFVESSFTYNPPSRARKLFGNLHNMTDVQIRALGNGELFANTIY